MSEQPQPTEVVTHTQASLELIETIISKNNLSKIEAENLRKKLAYSPWVNNLTDPNNAFTEIQQKDIFTSIFENMQTNNAMDEISQAAEARTKLPPPKQGKL